MEIEEKPKERGALFYFGIAAIVILAIVLFSPSFWSGFMSGLNGNQNQQQTNSGAKAFYTQLTSNVRSCDSLSCSVVGTYPANTEFDLPYSTLNDLPEWVQVSWQDNGKTVNGYINKVNFGDSQLTNQNSNNQSIAQQSEQSSQTITQSKSKADIVAEWSTKVAYVYCEWDYQSNGAFAFGKQGSGTLTMNKDGTLVGIMTNKHVVNDENGGSFPNFCKIYFPNDPNITTVFNVNEFLYDPNGNDAAVIVIDSPDDYIKQNATRLRSRMCYANYSDDIVEGNEVLFMGYPAIGSPTSRLGLKTTQGIISGFDGNYYLTDAKIEEGNSGGTAILIKDDCYLGIPTYKIYGPSYEYYSGVLNPAAVFGSK